MALFFERAVKTALQNYPKSSIKPLHYGTAGIRDKYVRFHLFRLGGLGHYVHRYTDPWEPVRS